MSDQNFTEGASTSGDTVLVAESNVELNIKTLDSQMYNFRVDKSVGVLFLFIFVSIFIHPLSNTVLSFMLASFLWRPLLTLGVSWLVMQSYILFQLINYVCKLFRM